MTRSRPLGASVMGMRDYLRRSAGSGPLEDTSAPLRCISGRSGGWLGRLCRPPAVQLDLSRSRARGERPPRTTGRQRSAAVSA